MGVQYHNPFSLPEPLIVLTASEGSKIFLSGLCNFSVKAHMAHTRFFPPPEKSRHRTREMFCLSLKIKKSLNYKFTAERNYWSKKFCLGIRVTYTAATASCICTATHQMSRSAKCRRTRGSEWVSDVQAFPGSG